MTCDGSEPLRVTLVYADPPGNPAAAIDRINDLTLKMISPTGTVYWGNNGLKAGNWSTSGGSANTLDTVENVFIESPEVGSWTIEVKADVIVQDGHVETGAMDADYALVASGGLPNAPPIWNSDPTVKSDAKEDKEYSASFVDVGDEDVNDPDGIDLTFTKDSFTGPGSDWLMLDSDGALSGTPVQIDIGSNSWDVTATDEEGAASTAVVTIQVLSVSDFDADDDVDGDDLNDETDGWKANYGLLVDGELVDGFAFLAWQLNYTGSSVIVPDVVNFPEGAANDDLFGLGLTMGTRTESYSLTFATGNVISSTPAAGTYLFVGDSVGLEISLGSDKPIPNVVGLIQSSAEASITGEGFTVGDVTSFFHETVADTLVISQDPTWPNDLILLGEIDFVVSLGLPSSGILEDNPNQDDKVDVKDGQKGAQSFVHNTPPRRYLYLRNYLG